MNELPPNTTYTKTMFNAINEAIMLMLLLLGHSDISVTYNIYIGINEDDKQSAVEAAFDTIKGS